MAEAMKQAKGVGIAAPQIGYNVRIFLVDHTAFWHYPSQNQDSEKPLPNFKFLKGSWLTKNGEAADIGEYVTFVNPEITYLSRESTELEEGCLSLMEPEEIRAIVKRAKKVTIKARRENGTKFKLQGKRLLARALQHETDHLEGKLITDVAIKTHKAQ